MTLYEQGYYSFMKLASDMAADLIGAKLETLMANVLQTFLYSKRVDAIEADLAKLRDQETALLPQTPP